MELTAMFREFAGWAGPAMATALWQGVALALALAVCLRLTPRISAADRFRVWVAGFAALAVTPFLPGLMAFFVPAASSRGGAAALAAGTAPRPWLDLDPRWTLAIAAVWMAASLARAVDLGVHAVRLRRLWKKATPIDIDFGANFGAGRPVEVCATRDLDRPSVIGFLAPRILVPEWLLERLTDAELEQVVLHETEHLRRRDDWTNLLQKLCLVVFPLNPALAWMERRLCREREMACDEGVVRRTRAPRAYAACLASLAERGFERRAESLSLGAWRRRPELVERVHRILRRGPGLHPAAARVLVGVVGCGLVFGAVELARCPQLVEFAAQPASETAAQLNPATVAAREGAPRMVNAEYLAGSARLGSPFRAMDAVARVSSRAELAARRRSRESGARLIPAFATGKNREDETRSVGASLVRNTSPSADSAQDFDSLPIHFTQDRDAAAQDDTAVEARTNGGMQETSAQQWIVLTEWEQVETTTETHGEDQASRAAVQYATAVEPATGLVAHRAASGDVVMSAPEPEAPNETAVAPGAQRYTRQFTIMRLILQIYPAGGNTLPGTTAGTGSKASSKSGRPDVAPLREGWLVIQL